MGFFSAELETMVELYQRETAELMEEFDARLTKAMQESRFSEQDINAVFRVVHTVKSSAAMMGLRELSSCTHKMEDLFLLFRDDPERARGNENRIFDMMYAFSDFIEKENDRVSSEDFKPENADAVITAIDREIEFFSGEGEIKAETAEQAETPPDATSAAQTEYAAATEEADAGSGETMLLLKLRPNCQMENVRSFMLVRQIKELCGSITTIPENLEAAEAAEQIAKDGLLLRLRTVNTDEVARRLAASPYVLSVKDAEAQSAKEKETADAESGESQEEDDDISGRQNKFSMVSWSHVMRLQNITGELITANTILGASLSKIETGGNLENEYQTMKRLFHELENLVAAVSMMPVSSIVPQYYRLVRDIAQREGKQIRLDIKGEELEVDRNLLDTLSKPLIHMLRNAADHGIEPPEVRVAAGKDPCGVITLSFENMSDHIRVTVSDDGSGINTQMILKKAADRGLLTKSADQYTEEEALNLVFLPGFSLNEKTNQYSGRGVGMDVVQNVAASLGGSVTLSSELTKGSTIFMEVPVSVTSTECVKFAVGEHTCLIPIRCVVRIYSFAELESRIQSIDGRDWLQTEQMIPVIDMFKLYGEKQIDSLRIIVIKDVHGSAALITGSVAGQQTAVEKPLPPMLGRQYKVRTGIMGCTVTETGKLGIMLNADWLIKMCGRNASQDGNLQ